MEIYEPATGRAICRIAHAATWDGEPNANAEFIVRACNCHEELVKACQALLDHIDSGRSEIRWTSKDTLCPGEVGNLDALRAALNKATK